MLFSTEEVQTKALNEVTFEIERENLSLSWGRPVVEIYLVEYTWDIRYPYFGLLSL